MPKARCFYEYKFDFTDPSWHHTNGSLAGISAGGNKFTTEVALERVPLHFRSQDLLSTASTMLKEEGEE